MLVKVTSCVKYVLRIRSIISSTRRLKEEEEPKLVADRTVVDKHFSAFPIQKINNYILLSVV